MVQANQFPKEILTLGEKWQSFATDKFQQHQPQWKILLFRENLLKKTIKLLDKWQVNDSELQPVKSQFSTNIQSKYLSNANKFQRRQHQQNFLVETGDDEDWWQDFDLVQQSSPQFNQSLPSEESSSLPLEAQVFNPQSKTKSPQISINRQILLTQQQSEIVENITKKYNRVSSQSKSTLPDSKPVIDLVSQPQASPQVEPREIERQIEQSSYSNINARLRNFLSNLLNIRIPNVKIYSNQIADNYAKKLDADAITYEDKVLIRTGKYNPQKPENIALIGHELTHAANLVPQRANYRYPRSDAAEEAIALSNEQKVLNYFASPETAISYQQPSIVRSNLVNDFSGNQLNQSAPTSIKKAESNREVNPSEASVPQMGFSDGDKLNLKEEIKREIIEEIRRDSERGG